MKLKESLSSLHISRGTNTKQQSYKLESILRVAISGLKTYVCLPACTFCGKLQNSSDAKQTIRLYSAFYLTSVAVSQWAILHAIRNTFYLHNVPICTMCVAVQLITTAWIHTYLLVGLFIFCCLTLSRTTL